MILSTVPLHKAPQQEGKDQQECTPRLDRAFSTFKDAGTFSLNPAPPEMLCTLKTPF